MFCDLAEIQSFSLIVTRGVQRMPCLKVTYSKNALGSRNRFHSATPLTNRHNLVMVI